MKSKILWVLFALLGSFGIMYYCQYPKPESIGDFENFKKHIVHTNVDYSVYGREYADRAEYRAHIRSLQRENDKKRHYLLGHCF